MKLPKMVKVGGHRITIKEVPDNSYYGQYHRWKNEILINRESCADQKATTLLHEILHAVFEESGLKQWYKDKSEEEIVRLMEPLLFQVIRDNPQVIKFIQGGRR